MKITDVHAWVVVPDLGPDSTKFPDWQWTFVTIETDEGLSGWGEASSTPRNGSLLTGFGVQQAREALIGEDPADVERLWQKLFRRYTYLGSRGFASTVISGIDIALWDLKGKSLGRPVYDLLGGKMRPDVRLYANGWFGGCSNPAQYAEAAKGVIASGHDALKLDPFLEMQPFHTMYQDGQISAEGENQGSDIVSAIREAVGPDVEILIDAHGNFNVPVSVRLANRLYDESKIGWFEEPVPPEGLQALKSARDQVRAPICVGERLFTRWEFVPVLEGGLADYIMPDVVWTGGISELKKIATMAEAYYVPISPHNAQGPGQILAGAHVSLSVPNFYRLEHAVEFIPGYNAFLQEPLQFTGNRLVLNDRPGLGIDLDMDRVKKAVHPQWVF
ncbi:MAG: mandelate racemase [Planctomycetaceae bacterium]|nr:mandelate racemase [Planctomycetaceae bacterium]